MDASPMPNNLSGSNQPMEKPSLWATNPRLKMLLVVLIFVFLGCGIFLIVLIQIQNQASQKIYEETVAGLPKHQTSQTGTPVPGSDQTTETGPETVCKTNNDCWCRNFNGAKFNPGKAPSVCNTKINRCQACFYE